MDVIISHADADGIISASFILKYKPKAYLHFSSPSILHKTLCKILDLDPETLYILDISANTKSAVIASLFKKVIWIDHHLWENFDIPKNVEVFVEEAESTAKIVAKVLKIDTHLVRMANEIDTNSIKSEESKFFRDLISAIKWKYNKLQIIKFRQISKILAFKGLEELEKDLENTKIIEEHLNWLNSLTPEIIEKTQEFEVNGKKVLIFETNKSLPVYFIYEKLNEAKNFDILCVFYRKVDMKRKIPVTKIELRSKNDDLLKVARYFNGGGHRLACGATLPRYLSVDEFLQKLKESI
jgi:oligoribonuclease NrnB/cAMP/cGMP phosphodiesterase (DHH superfamily)